MKIFTHVALILVAGIAIGLITRQVRQATRSAGPGAGEIVFGNDNAVADNASLKSEDVANNTPTKPPEEAEWLSEFELTERSGELVSTEDLKGAPYVVSFFFSTCPSICVNQNTKLKELQDRFAGRGVRFVAISVDPETDTPEVLQEYAARFGADPEQWLFLTGELNYIRRIGGEIFQQPVNKQFHTERFVLVDAEGKIEGFYNWPEPEQMVALNTSISSMLGQTDEVEPVEVATTWNTLAANLPHLNALLNLIATALLALGLYNIKNGRAKVHKKMMLRAFVVSMVFLLCYLFHKFALYQSTGEFNRRFPADAPDAARYTYLAILIPHILLAITVPFLAIRAIYLAKNGRIVAHKKLVRFAFPIWMYVSVTGVLVYAMLYQLYA